MASSLFDVHFNKQNILKQEDFCWTVRGTWVYIHLHDKNE